MLLDLRSVWEPISGEGAVVVGVSALEAYGAATVSAVGTVTISAPAISGTGAEAFAGTGAEAFAVASIAATGAETFAGTGVVAIGANGFEGQEPYTATGSVVIGANALSATATQAFEAAAEVAFSVADLAGDGGLLAPGDLGEFFAPLYFARDYFPATYFVSAYPVADQPTGTAEITITAPSIQGQGAIVAPDVEVILPPPAGAWWRVPAAAISGRGTFTAPAMALAAQGHVAAQQVTGVGSVAMPVAGIVATGQQAIAGTGRAEIAALGLSAVGRVESKPVETAIVAPVTRPRRTAPRAFVTVSQPAIAPPLDAIDRAWLDLQRAALQEEDELFALGVFD